MRDYQNNLYSQIIREDLNLDGEGQQELLDYMNEVGFEPVVLLDNHDLEFKISQKINDEDFLVWVADLIQSNHINDITIHNLELLIEDAQRMIQETRAKNDALVDIVDDCEKCVDLRTTIIENLEEIIRKQAVTMEIQEQRLDMREEMINDLRDIEEVAADAENRANQAASQLLILEEELQAYESMGFWARLGFLFGFSR